MKTARSTSVTVKAPIPQTTPAPEGLLGAWTRFWFRPIDPVGLHVVRVLAGLLFLAWLLPFAGHLQELFGLQGWFDQQAYTEAARLPEGMLPPLGWSILYWVAGNPALLTAVYWVSIAVLVLFTAGVWTRLTGVLTWVIVASFTANPAISYDGDVLLLILSLYLMVGYLLLDQRRRGQSFAARLLGSAQTLFLGRWFGRPRPSTGANLALRLLQVHFAIVVVMSGLHKLQFGDWWSGVALWYPLHPAFQTTVDQARAGAGDPQFYLLTLSTAAYAALVWQVGFPLFAWRPRWRPLLLGGAAISWLVNIWIFGQPLLGEALFVGCLSFVSPAGWHRIFDWVARWLPLPTSARSASSEAGDPSALGPMESPLALGGHR